MHRTQVLELLRQHQAEIGRRFAVRSLALFGSHARDEARPDSDVDLLVEFVGEPTWSGYMGLIEYLEALFGVPVDLATAGSLKPRLRPYVERELIHVP